MSVAVSVAVPAYVPEPETAEMVVGVRGGASMWNRLTTGPPAL